MLAAGSMAALFLVAAVTAGVLQVTGHPVHAGAAPLFAHWLPHVGPGTPLVAVVAFLTCRYGPDLAQRLRWRPLLAASYATAVAWTLSLALVDGWQRGVAGRLTTGPEYLTEVPGVTSIPAMVRGFSDRILDGQPDSWTTHVSGHPPGALLVFTVLDRLGLSGGAWAGLVCIAVGGLTAVAVPVTVRLLGSDRAGRAAVPFVALFPGAVWIGVSADGLFAGVVATGTALLAYGVVRRASPAAFAAGLLLGLGAYLSYGLVLMAVVAVTVVAVALAGHRSGPRPSRRPGWHAAAWATAGVAVMAAAWTAAGFDWLTGYHLVTQRYYQGIAAHRPYAYWVWADLAILAVAAGPVAAAILRRAIVTAGAGLRSAAGPPQSLAAGPPQSLAVWPPQSSAAGPPQRFAVRRPRRYAAWPPLRFAGLAGQGVWLLPLAATAAILLADLSGYSKAEVERIWLPFTVWLMAGAALLPPTTQRRWLIAQALVAVAVNHIVLTVW
ncbi:hypothetical protein GCM10010436_68210 [Paractinoplanes durhamensis]